MPQQVPQNLQILLVVLLIYLGHRMIQDIKIATMVSASTTTLGMGVIFDWIPNDIGKLASLVGVLLSIVLIYFHIRKGRLDNKKSKIELEILEDKKRKLDDGT